MVAVPVAWTSICGAKIDIQTGWAWILDTVKLHELIAPNGWQKPKLYSRASLVPTQVQETGNHSLTDKLR